MWPRGDASQGPGSDMTVSRSKKSAGLSGFVSFMKRKDAETAIREMDGFDWGGFVLRVGWSKAVPIAAKAAYVGKLPRQDSSTLRMWSYLTISPWVVERHAEAKSRSRSRSRSPDKRSGDKHGPRRKSRSYSRSRSRSLGDRDRDRSRSYSRDRNRDRRRQSRSRSRSYTKGQRRYSSRSYSPRSRSPRRSRSSDGGDNRRRTGVDPEMEKFIRTVALKVKQNGEKFEDMLRERERQNKKFGFLFDLSVSTH